MESIEKIEKGRKDSHGDLIIAPSGIALSVAPLSFPNEIKVCVKARATDRQTSHSSPQFGSQFIAQWIVNRGSHSTYNFATLDYSLSSTLWTPPPVAMIPRSGFAEIQSGIIVLDGWAQNRRFIAQ